MFATLRVKMSSATRLAATAGVLLVFGAAIVLLSPEYTAPPSHPSSPSAILASMATGLMADEFTKSSNHTDEQAGNNSLLAIPLVNKDLVEYFGTIYIGTPRQKFQVRSLSIHTQGVLSGAGIQRYALTPDPGHCGFHHPNAPHATPIL